MSTVQENADQSAESAETTAIVAAKRSGQSVVTTAVVVIATIAVIWSLQWAKAFFIPLAIAIFMTFWLMPLVDLLHRWHIPRTLSAAVVLSAVLVGLGGTGYSLRNDAREFVASLSDATHHARSTLQRAARDREGWLHTIRSALTDRPINARSQRAQVPPAVAAEEAVAVESAVIRSSPKVAAIAADIVVMLFLIYLLLASGDLFKRKLMTVISGHLSKQRITVDILREIGVQFQRYLLVMIGTNLILGFLTWAVFAALGVEHAAVWGLAAAVLHFIPYLGPAVIAGAAFLVTSAQFNSLGSALMVASFSLLIAALIGMLLTTVLASRAAHMNSVAVFAGLMFWTWLWGVPGLLLGTPLVMATKVIADRIDSLNWLATLLSGPPKRERRPKQEPSERKRRSDVAEVEYATSPPAPTLEAAVEVVLHPTKAPPELPRGSIPV